MSENVIRVDGDVGAQADLVMRSAVPLDGIGGSVFTIECVGPDGKVKWVERVKNLFTTEGRNYQLDVSLRNQTPKAAWYVGLIDNSPAPTLAAGDTGAQIGGTNGWSEATPYSGNRPQWVANGAASNGQLSNSNSKASFAINATASIYGAFLCDTTSGVANVLYGETAFSAVRSVQNGDTLNVQVDPSLTSA